MDLVEDGNNIEDEIDSILKNPVFIDALNVANYDKDDGLAPEKSSDSTNSIAAAQHLLTDGNPTNGSQNSPATHHRTIEKLRIAIPAMASPTASMHSSSSESHSPVRSKKNKKRFCIKCCMRFKHTADWLHHCMNHVTLPDVKLEKLDTSNTYYKDYMERIRSKRSRSPSDTESLKIKLKIPRDSTSTFSANSMGDSNPGTPAATPPVQMNECRIRVLRAEEIKQSPPRSPLKHTLPEHAMVAVPSENRVHYECPTLDGLHQFAEEAMNEESTAQILKNLLETPNEPPESNDWDSANSNEFISIDRLGHTCKTCNEKYPDLHILHEHQRLTGHGDRSFLSPSMLEPIQEMTIDPNRRYHPPLTNHLENLLGSSKNTGPPQPPPPMYGQPPVLPIHQMENQVRNFGGMSQMMNRAPNPRFALPPRHPSQMPPSYPMHRNYPMPPPSLMRSNNGMHSNQPLNMAPFLEMSPDMYNPQQTGGNGYDRSPNQMMHRLMPQQQQQSGLPHPQQRMPQHDQQAAMMQRYQQQHQQQQQHPHAMPPQQRPTMNGPGPLVSRPLRNLPPYPMRPPHPHMGGGKPGHPSMMPGPAMQRPPSLMPSSSMGPSSLEQQPQQKARFEQMQMARNREIENRPFISNAPPTDGLPGLRIESVQSGAITLNSAKKSTDPNATIQISDQITLSLKNKDKVPEKLPSATAGATSAAAAAVAAAAATAAASLPMNDTNKMKTFLANRGTVKLAMQ